MNRLKAFFGPVADSVKGTVNAEELSRTVRTALASGLVGLALAVVDAVSSDAPNIFRASSLPIVLAALTYVHDSLRRMDHGTPAS